MKPPGREGGEGARIHNDSQEGKYLIRYDQQESAMICKNAKIDLLRSASKATMQSNTSKRAHKEPCNSRGPPHRSHTEVGEDCWPTRSSLTLPK